jgi:hypothetical protein
MLTSRAARLRASVAISATVVAFACNGGGGSGSAGGGGSGSTSATTATGFATGGGAGGECGLGGASDQGRGCAMAKTGVHFGADVAPVLAGCTGEACHGAFTYASTVNVPSTECCDGRLLVTPGDASHSYLVDKIRAHHLCTGRPMPLDAPALAPTDVDAIVGWICAGAAND